MLRRMNGVLRATIQLIRRAALLAALLPVLAFAAPFKTEHVTAELVSEHGAVAPGGRVRIGLLLQHIPHWHSYWRNPGDSGLPTTLGWTLPAGSQVSEIAWPAPMRLPIGPLVNYGYEGELLLPVVFTAPPGAIPGTELKLQARADWLVCKDVCIPEGATLELRLPVVGAGVTPGSTRYSALFDKAAAEAPVTLQGWKVDLQQAGSELLLQFHADDPTTLAASLPAVQVFPYAEQLIEPAVHALYRTDDGYAVKLKLLAQVTPPQSFGGIAVAQRPSGDGTAPWGQPQRAVEFNAPWRQVDALALPAGAQRIDDGTAAPTRGAVSSGNSAAAAVGTWSVLLLAFVGGLLLNLMPCVFPVLSIKLIALSRESHSVASQRFEALAYGGGVLLSFLALAGALIGLRAAGQAVGWGFQLQEPGVVLLLALLFFAIGLNLIGVFEFATLLPQSLAAWRAKRPAADAFASGVLVVVAASPCTAPFMGAALGYALTESAAMALAVFAALGLGMALPFALLTWLPRWRRLVPKAGPWMLHLQQALAFPMFATAVWLLWVLGQQAGVDAMARLLLLMVVLAAALWLGALAGRHGVWRKSLGVLAVLALGVWSWPSLLAPAAPAPLAEARSDDAWAPYSESELSRLLAQGQPVFVDFTAAWCVSCQVNKRLVLETPATQREFAAANVRLMRADWTRRDAAITDALARLGRNGVPVYALFRPGRDTLLLPEILTGGAVREALASLSP